MTGYRRRWRAAALAAALPLLSGCIPGLGLGGGTTVCMFCSTSSSATGAVPPPGEAPAPAAEGAPEAEPGAGTPPGLSDLAPPPPPDADGPGSLLDALPLPDSLPGLGSLPGAQSEAPPGEDAGAALEDALGAGLREREGLELNPYLDQSGRIHIGYGHSITVDIAERLLEEDMADALAAARRVVGEVAWAELTTARRQVLAEMAYMLGETGLSGFENMLAATRTGDYALAADELLDSELAAQSPSRATRLAALMRRG